MKPTFVESYGISALTIILGTLAVAPPANSQPITPANDGTGTTVNQNGNQFNIEGGTRSGANLFHSFDQFNVNSGQTANFVTTPDTSNILGRITGGNASYINGLIQVIGSNSNLFLMNPAGIMFGPNASLNIPASFSVTTATGIGFDNNNYWFKAMGTNDYANLIGDPSGYRFNVSNPGAIVNEANLTLNAGENLTLLGGTVINTGELSTAGGNITIAAVEGGSTLRISQPGHLLSLEVNSTTVNGEDANITPLSLPNLLTGGSDMNATSITVDANGDVVLTASNTVVEDVAGMAIASGSVDVSSPPNTPSQGGDETKVGGQVNVLGDRVALIDSNINADGLDGGGTVLIGGNSEGTVFNSQETSVNSGSIISATAIENGDGGNVIIWSDGNTNFAGNISAKGGEFSGNGGFVEVTGQELTFDGSVDVTAALGENGTILLQPESATIGEPENSNNSQIAQDDNANVTISAENIGELSGNVILEADNDITVNEKIETDSSVELKAGRSININADIDTSIGNGNIDLLGNNDEMNAANRSEGAASINQLDGTTLNAGSGTINIELGNLGEVGNINLANLTTTGQVLVNANGGNIARVSDSSIINAGSVLFQTNGSGGIGLTDAPLQLNVQNLEAVSGSGGVFFDVGNVNIGRVSENVNGISVIGGKLEIQSEGDVTLEEKISTDGAIKIEATGDISATGSGISSNGESVSLSATNISIADEFDETSGDADINLSATNDITIEDIADDVLEFMPGAGAIEFRADADGDGVGNVTVLDNQPDVASDPSSFNNGADNINTNGRYLTVTGASIVLGNINTSDFEGVSGSGGAINIEATQGNISAGKIDSSSNPTFNLGNGGNITISAINGDITTDFLYSSSSSDTGNSGNGGTIVLEAGGNITTGSLNSFSDVFSETGSLDRADSGNGGAIFLEAGGNITTGFLNSYSLSERGNSGNGGAISLEAGGSITTKSVESSSYSFNNGNSGNGGAISLEAGSNITTESIESLSYSLSGNHSGNAGAISLKAGGNITTKSLESFSFSEIGESGNGGGLFLEAGGDVNKLEVRTFSVGKNHSGDGGNVNITNTNNLSNVEILTLSSHSKSGDVRIESQPQGNLQLSDSSIITSKQVTIEAPFIGEVQIGIADTQGESGNVSIFSSGNINLNNVTIESDTKGNEPAGNVTIESQKGTISLNNTNIFSTTNAAGNAGDIILEADKDIKLTNNSKLKADTESRGNAGNIILEAPTLELNQNSRLSTETSGAGVAGIITIKANTIDIKENAEVSATVTSDSTIEAGDGEGNINIFANTLNISGTRGILAETEGGANAGNVTIQTYQDNPDININFSNSGFISASSESTGDGGNISIIASENINIAGDGGIRVTTDNTGNAGIIDIDTKNLTTSNGVSITASTTGDGNAGVIDINSKTFNLQTGTSLTTETNSAGKAGDIGINSEILTIGEGAEISATAKAGATNTDAGGGNININANELNISGRLGIFAETQGEAPAGTLTLQPYQRGSGNQGREAVGENRTETQVEQTDPNLDINFSNKGFISASTTSTGNGGNINISAPETIDISGDGKISVETTGTGNAGNINIDTQKLTLKEGVSISAETNSPGRAGNIEIHSPLLTIGTNTQISATAKENATNTEAEGGNISIFSNQLNISGKLGIFAETKGEAPAGTLTLKPYNNTPDLDINFSNQGFISARTTSIGNGGNINISAPETIDISGDGKISVETTGTGNAGNIDIDTQDLTTSDRVSISASTVGDGNAGAIDINTKTFNLQTGTSLTTETNSAGKAGDISINSETLTIGEGAEISATAKADATNTEAGGNISINTNILNIGGDLGIFAETQGNSPAGTLTINPYKAGTLHPTSVQGLGEFEPNLNITFTNDGFISASTTSIGNGGNINISAPESIDITGNGRITVETVGSGNAGDVNINTGSLTVTNGTQISASSRGIGNAGSVNIIAQNSVVFDGASRDGTQRTEASSVVTPTAEGNAGDVNINTGSLTVSNGALISSDLLGKGKAGSVNITAENIVLDGVLNDVPSAVSSTLREGAEGEAGNVTIETGSLTVTNGAQISASTAGKGNAGTINITAQDSVLFDGLSTDGTQRSGAYSVVTPVGEREAGDVTINTNSLTVTNGALISSDLLGKGKGGSVNITAENIVLDGVSNDFPSEISSILRVGAEGEAGNVTINTGALTVTNGGEISVSTQGTGNAGNLEITAQDTLVFDRISSDGGHRSGAFSLVESTAEGNAGDIKITTGSLEVTNGAAISADTFGTGNAGSVEITAQDSIVFDGVSNGFPSSALSSVQKDAVGNAGGVTIETGSLEVTNGAVISASTEGTGKAGRVNIAAEDSVVFDGASNGLFSSAASSVAKGAVGDAGGVTIETDSLEVTNGALISATTAGKGDAGNVEIIAQDRVVLDGVSLDGTQRSRVSSLVAPQGIGNAGEITIETGSLEVTNGAVINASTQGKGNAGSVNITAEDTVVFDGRSNRLSSAAFSVVTPNAVGDAGDINITAGSLEVTNGAVIDASTKGNGDGGNIIVEATERFNLDNFSRLAVETSSSGKAGNIEINSPEVNVGTNSVISATAKTEATNTEEGGNISINTNILNISTDTGIFAETDGATPAGTITFTPYNNNSGLNINFNNSGNISARSTSTGKGGNINITAPETVNITGDGKISVETTGAGNAGTIEIETQNLTTTDGIDITASTTGAGNAGNINVTTNNFNLEAGTSLTTETDSSGSAGDITINSQILTIGEGAKISATALENAVNTDTAGNITINSNELNIFGELGIFAETQGEAPAGTLNLNTYNENPDLNINFSNSGFISARTTSSGNGGNINLFAPESINITGDGKVTVETQGTGNAGIINIDTQNLTIAEATTISATTSNSGAGGSININSSQTFQLDGQLLTETTSTGAGGNITINTGSLTAENGTISARSTETATGNAGSIEITGQENITTGIITSSANNTTEAADGGQISITSQQGEINATQPIQSFSEKGNAGDVTLNAQTNVTTNIISSHGQQKGGQINITAETGNIDTSNGFLANYSGGGNGGNVTLNAPQGDITTSNISSFADGNGGQINIKAGREINLAENSNIISASEVATDSETDNPGTGGDITLEAGSNINTTTTRIYSGANVGDTGTVDINAESAIEVGNIDLASGFVREKVEFNDNNNFTLIPIPEGEATQGKAGNISITSNNGTIDTTAGTINSRSPDGSGNITIEALGNITTGKLEASALNTTKATTGGDITITSQQGKITATQAIETFSEQGTAGSVNIDGAGHVEVNTILSQGTQQGGDITIESSSENSIDVQEELNTFSTEGIAGNITLISPGNITLNGIRSEGMEQGGNITVESEIGNIDASGGDIDSYSEQGIGGDIQLNASEGVNLANVSSYGMTESGDLTIQSQTAEVNTGNVTTEAPEGSSGSIAINGTEVGTGDLSSIGTTSAGEINVEATDGSINTYDVEIESEGTIGTLTLRATEDINTEDITQAAGEGDANIDISSGEDQNIGDISQTAEEDTTNNQIAEGNITTGDISQTAGDDATNIQDTSVNVNTDNATDIQAETGNITTGDINQTAGDDATNIQDTSLNINTDNTSNIQANTGNITTGDISQDAGDNVTNIQDTSVNINNENIANTQTETGDATNNIITNIEANTGSITTENITQEAGDDITNNQDTSVNINNENIANTQTETGDATNNIITNIEANTGSITTENITQEAGDDVTNIQDTSVNINNENIANTQTETGDATNNIITNIEANTGNITTGDVTQTAGDDITNSQDTSVNINNENIANTQTETGDATNNIITNIEANTGSITTENITQTAGNDVTNNQDTSVNINNENIANTQTETGDATNNIITNIEANTGSITTENITQTTGNDVLNSQNTAVNATNNNTANIQTNTGSVANNNTTNIQASTGDIFNNTITQTAGNDVLNSQNTAVNANNNNTANIQTNTGNVANNIVTNIEANTGNITTENITQTAGNDAINNQNTGLNTINNNRANIQTNTGDVVNNNTNNIQANTGNIVTGNINQTARDNTINNQNTRVNNTNNNTINIQTNGGQVTTNDNTNISVIGGNITTENITQTAGNDITNIQATFGDITTGNINQTVGNNTTNIQTARGQQNLGNINQTVGNNTTNIQTARGQQNLGNINQTAGNNTTNIQTARGQQNLGNINQNFGNESINIHSQEINQNTSQISVNLNDTTPSNNNQTKNTGTSQEQTEESTNHATDSQQILKIIDSVNTNSLKVSTASEPMVTMLETSRSQEYSEYFGEDFKEELTNTKNVRDILTDMAAQTGKESAVVYVNTYSDQLQIILYTKDGKPIIKTIPEAKRKKLMKVVLKLRAHITNPARRNTKSYLPAAQQLYDWIIAPISAELAAANIDTLLFSMDEGLRTLPIAALHNGEEFLIEKYSISLIPSMTLMDTNYRPLQDTQVLAMGASKFMEQDPLPAVPVELETISQELWQGSKFINENFTRNNLLNERKNYPYPIIHLATHAEFLPGNASNSYIQLWGDEQIKLDQVRELGWNEPAVELLVLSACRTAVGDRNAELGYAGLAVAAGVKSALASIWYVSDEGTLGLMTEFYTHLNDSKIKAEALRQAQLAMLRGEVVIADGQLRGTTARGAVVLPPTLRKFRNQDLSHPYYWSGFTMVGSPW